MNLCYLLADRIHRHRMRRTGMASKAKWANDRQYWEWQYCSSATYFARFFDLHDRLAGADVIDIGCGLGGRTCYLATQGVRRIVGTDINHAEIDRATQLADMWHGDESRSFLQFRRVSEDHDDLTAQFDIALLVDSLEHVRDPVAMLNRAHSLLKPGGVCYFSTWGWYHHQASHVSSIVPIPFATVFFSDRQILDAVRRIVDQPYYQPSLWDSKPPSRRWRNCHTLHDRPGEYLNKYTISRFRKAMRASRFPDWQLKVQGFSAKRHPLLAAFNLLTCVPGICELYHSAIFGRLVKAETAGMLRDKGSPEPMRVSV